MSQIIAEYKFNNILYDLIPEFNEGFEYTYKDVLEENVTTRTIYSNELPTLLRFGNSDTSGETGDSNKYNSLLEVLYLASSEITYAGLMFHRCANVSYICPFILTNKNNSLHGIFSGCHSLTSLDVSNFDTSNVIDMSYAFYTNNLIELDLSDWDTSNVTNMNHILYRCQNLKTLNISNWNLNNVDNIGWFVNQCNNLNEIIMNDSDYKSVNKIISELPITTNGSKCNFCIGGVDDISKVNIREGWDIMNQYKIAEYKFNSSIDTLFSEVNEGFVYTHTDIDNGDGTITRTIYSDQLPTMVRFENCEGLLEVNYLNTSELTTLRKAFKNCYNVTSINATNWDTSKVTSLYEAFEDCNNLTQLDVSNWNTSNVTDMAGMFFKCNSLTSIGDVSNWNTGNVTNMYVMFAKCNKLTTLDVSNWDTRNVTDMAGMFEDCNSLTSIGDVSNWNTGNVTNMYAMFLNCDELTTLDVSNFDTSNVTNMSCLFEHCKKLTSLDVSNFNTSNVIEMHYMFEDCQSLTSLDLSNFNTSNVTNMTQMINECYALTELNISNWHLNSEVDVTDMFKDTNVLTNVTMNNSDYNSINKIIAELPTRTTDSMGHLYIEGVDDHKLVNKSEAGLKYWAIMTVFPNIKYYTLANEAEGTFAYPIINSDESALSRSSISIMAIENEGSDETVLCIEIETQEDINSIQFVNPEYLLKMLILDTNNMTTMKDLFKNCTQLNSIECSDWDTSNVTDMGNMFRNCQSLTSLDVSNFNTSNVTDMYSMFYHCEKIEKIDLSQWNVDNVTSIEYMFEQCKALQLLDLSNFKLKQINSIRSLMFGCENLTQLNLSNWDIGHISDYNMEYLFNSTNLITMIMNNSDYNSVNKIISKLPTRTTLGYMYVSRDILNDTNVSEAESKMWRILPLGGRVKNVFINGNNVSNMITKQNKKIKGIYLGNTPLL